MQVEKSFQAFSGFNTAPKKMAFFAAPSERAQEAMSRMLERYQNVPVEEAEVAICLGGDGFLLETIHAVFPYQIPTFGIRCGSVGFLLNPEDDTDLPHRLLQSQASELHPLRMHAIDCHGHEHCGIAFNDVFLFRQTRQAIKVEIAVDGCVRLPELVCDGVILATPAGSTAYNLSAHGPIVPLSTNLLPLTPISPFRPRRWRGALLPSSSEVAFTLREVVKRPAAAVADFMEVRDVKQITVCEDRNLRAVLLFDPNLDLSERIVAEQFVV